MNFEFPFFLINQGLLLHFHSRNLYSSFGTWFAVPATEEFAAINFVVLSNTCLTLASFSKIFWTTATADQKDFGWNEGKVTQKVVGPLWKLLHWKCPKFTYTTRQLWCWHNDSVTTQNIYCFLVFRKQQTVKNQDISRSYSI